MMATIEPGQFDDAPEDTTTTSSRPVEHTYIDLSDSESSTEDEQNVYSDDYDEYSDNRVEDEDWEIAEKVQRLRQHVAVRSGNAQGVTSSLNEKSAVAVLPAVNHPQSRQTHNHNSTPHVSAKDKTTDQLSALAKYSSRLAKIDMPYASMGVGVNRKGPSATANIKDKSDRATNEQVLDPRTRLILFKMINKGLIHEVNGCISTGKEANVYHALTPPEPTPIYKTSILIFKDRDKYVSGEHRFRRGYSRRNPRKMVRLWAEKEMRNLKRLSTAGIRAPEAIEVRENVLVMDFLGDGDGWASPRLKDAELTREQCDEMYVELLLAVRTMFHQCHLVHADLSEYNVLFHEGHLWIIDVSQSNVEEFFGRRDARFEFVIKDADSVEDAASMLAKWREDTVDGDQHEEDGAKETHEDEVFRKSYIPRSLNDLYDPERDQAHYADTIGLVEEPTKDKDAAKDEEDSDEDEDEDEEGDSGTEDENEGARGHRHEDKDAKKERKKAVKAEAREKRKHKMPKAEKKRSMKKGRG
ncbi:RIO1 family-domain-containing protein [Mucidula mucida]|nr:RIO1 family-domain-containing protein [Mucidula mucida]